MNRTITAALAGLAGLALSAAPLAATAAPSGSSSASTSISIDLNLSLGGLLGGSGPAAVGLTADQKLVAFKLSRPESPKTIGKVNGLQGDTKLVGIDVRVQNGKLYGVGDRGGIYTLSTKTAKATKVSQLSVALQGTQFGVDFNPAANRLRVISDTGQNLRHNIDDPAAPTTTTVDTPLNTPPTAGTTTGVVAAAYTNNDLDAGTATALFNINFGTDQVVLQSPANSGQLAPTGSLRVNATAGGMDIYTELDDDVAEDNEAWATLKVDGRYSLYEVSLLTGKAEREGRFPSGTQVTDLAIELDH